MLKRFASLVGAVAFASFIFVSCNESPSSPDANSFDKVAATSLTEVPNVDENLFRDPPTNPGDRGNRPPVPPGQRRQALDLQRIIRQLQLTDEQGPAVRECLAAYRECVGEANAAVRAARQRLMQAYQSEVADICALVASGELSRERAQARLSQLAARVRAALKDAMDRHEAAVASCTAVLNRCMHGVLTERQYAMWIRLTTPPARRP